MRGCVLGLAVRAASLDGCKMPNKLLWIADPDDAAQKCFEAARGTEESSRKII